MQGAPAKGKQERHGQTKLFLERLGPAAWDVIGFGIIGPRLRETETRASLL